MEKDEVLKNFNLTSNFLKNLENQMKKYQRNFGINKTKYKKKIIEKDFKINAEKSYYWKNISHKDVISF